MIHLNDDVIFHLESPVSISQRMTYFPIQGWIAGKYPIQNVHIASEPSRECILTPRPDVAEAYPSFPETCGFSCIIPTALIKENIIRLSFQAGEANHVQCVRLEPANQTDKSVYKFLKSINHAININEFGNGKVLLESTPVNINLETTNRCNLQCPSCARNYWDMKRNQIGDMDTKIVTILEPFLERVSSINFLGYGETVLSRNFKTIVNLVKSFHARLTMFSNGTTFSPNIVDFILDREIEEITFSIDGADEKTVMDTRTASFEKIQDNIKYLHKRCADEKIQLPDLVVSYTVSRKNIDQLVFLLDIAQDMGIKQVNVGHMKIFHPSQLEFSLFLDKDHAKRKFEAAKRRGDLLGINVTLPPPFEETVQCKQPFDIFLVKWNGNVNLCCSTAIESDPQMNIQAGNLYQETLEKLWNGQLAQRVRAGLIGKEKMHDICFSCPYTRCALDQYKRFLNE